MKMIAKMLLMMLLISISSEKLSPKIKAESMEEEKEGNGIMRPKTLVRIYNEIGEDEAVTIHCKSKDDDLGVHVIDPYESFYWKFGVNIFKSTLYFCGISWSHGTGVYEIYKAQRDFHGPAARCKVGCIWKVYKDGVHGYLQVSGVEDIFFKWNKTSLI